MDQDIVLENGGSFGMPEIGNEKARAIDNKITIGEKLFQARHALTGADDIEKLSVEKISSELCIRPHLLAALEQDDFTKFPSACYAAGFLKNYAAYLGLDVAQIVTQYKKEFQGSTKKVDLVFLEGEKTHNYPQFMMVSMVILSALVLYGVWFATSKTNKLLLSDIPEVSEVTSHILASNQASNRETALESSTISAELSENIPESLPENNDENNDENNAVDNAENDNGFQLVQQAQATSIGTKTKTTAVVADQVRLSVRDDAWVRIVSAEREILVDRVLLAGEEFYMTDYMTGRAGMKLMTSNAGALSIHVGNMAVAPLGEVGEVRDNISLDKQDLVMKTALLTR